MYLNAACTESQQLASHIYISVFCFWVAVVFFGGGVV